MMLFQRPICGIALLAFTTITYLQADSAIAEIYELRTYVTNEGQLDNLNARFRDHTIELFKKHGMESVGYWMPADEPTSKNTLIYVLRHQSRDAAAASWKAFLADPQWQKAFQASRVNGPLLAKRPDSVFMDKTDYSPKVSSTAKSSNDAVFELRTYLCNEGQLKNLDARFRDHTIGLFKRHGIESIAYWHPADEPASQDTLIYIVKHASRDAAAASWKAFSADEQWKKVAKESQKVGKFLRERPESVDMQATDYSAIK